MTTLNLIDAILANSETLLPLSGMYDYVVASNGLFIRAEDSRMTALIPVADCTLHGLASLEPYARLKVERIPAIWLDAILKSARKHLPKEVLYQFVRESDRWRCVRPGQRITSVSVEFADESLAVADLHSHNSMDAFFSTTDNADEAGFRFYCVVGRVDTDHPQISCRAGVYGHHWPVPVDVVFESAGPFADRFGMETE